ncbi:MAG: caspase family protein [Bacteroidetes bacterium]|nr:caspase family protein [Bacteroidota bacterium]
MKRFLNIIFLISATIAAQAQSKVALIVAIGNYEPSTGWSSISSQNDVPLIKAALIKQGFAEKDILVIRDAQATKEGILKAIDEHLIAKSTKDGIAVFHYSGHGQQVIDDNGDEIDGYDEALVSYNANMRYQKGIYEGQNHLRDEELGAKMDKLRLKIGSKGNVMVVLDACHSGTGTRGDNIRKHRGSDKPCAPDGYTSKTDKNEKNSIVSNARSTDKMASMVSFFGASPNELNYETEDENKNGVGSLSYAFSRVFSNAGKNSTYRGIFDKIKIEMSSFAPRQTPQAEGDLDFTILGGKITGKPEYFKVEKWKTDKTVTINGGELLGLYAKTKVAFYDIDTKDYSTAKPKATGVITSSSITSAEVTLDNPLDKNNALNSWIYVIEKNYGKLSVKIKMDISNASLKNSINEEIKKYPFISIVDEGADIIIDEGNKHSRGSQIKITSNTDYILLDEAVNSNTEVTIESVMTKIKEYSQANYIKGMEVTDAKMDVKFEFIPVETTQDGDRIIEKSRGDIKSKYDSSGILIIKAGESYKIKVTNNGTKDLYFTIIDIQPDNKINLVVPNAETGRTSHDYFIKRGESKELGDDDIIVFYPPTGNEVFKIIATEKPLDLSSIITTRGSGSRGENESPFAALFAETYKSSGSRGPNMPNVPQGSANVYTLTFKIVE